MKAIIFAFLVLSGCAVMAQYPAFSGGSNDGNANNVLVSSFTFNMYKGGNSDGFAFYNGIAPTPLEFYKGGSSDGFAYHNLAPATTFAMYKGGTADGNAQHSLTAPVAFNMYTGGNNDGFAFYNGIAPPPLQFYKGGSNDGFAYHNLSPATNFAMYKGGSADGFAYNKILPATTFAMYKGGNADGFAWDDNTTPPPCNAPVLQLNTISNITATGFSVSWNTVNTGSQYILKVYLQSDLSTPLFIANGLSAASINTRNFTGLTANTAYCVTVQEQCSPTSISVASNSICATTLPVSGTCAEPTTLQQLSNSSTSVTLGWTPGAGNTNYEVMLIRNSSTDTFRVSGSITANPQTATLTCLPTGTFFNYYVRESCGPNSWSAWVNGFTTYTSPGCSAPYGQTAKVVNTQNANLRFQSNNYYWPKPYQISYGVGIATPQQGAKTAIITPQPSQISGDTITHALFNVTDVGNTVWYVREICNQCDTTAWVGPNTVPATNCTTASLNNLSTTNITTTTATLSFTTVNYNSSARIELVDSIGNTTTVYNLSASGGYSHTQNVTGLTAGRIYKWREKEFCPTGDSTAYSPYRYFSTITGGSATCPAPTALGVFAYAGPNLIVQWNSTQYPNGFKYQVAHGQGIASPGVAPNVVTQNYFMTQSPSFATYYIVGGNNQGYTFFVRDICSAGDTSAWAGPYIVGSSKTDETGIELPLANNGDENFNWSIYPNPNRGNLLNITASKAITGEVVIMDVTGAMVANYKLNADSNKQLNIDYLAQGIYIVKLLAGEEVYTKKLTISK